MSEALLEQWRGRVLEVQTEIGVVEDEIVNVASQRKNLKRSIRAYEEGIQREKQDLLKQLEEVEAMAKSLGEQCEATVAERDATEELYVSTLDEYESMHFVVRDIKEQEEDLTQREDLESKLHRQSLEWAEEEHGMRARLNALQSQLRQQRKAQEAEVTELNAELNILVQEQRRQRAERCGDSAQPAPSTRASQAGELPTVGASPIDSAEAMFVAANTGTSVPTKAGCAAQTIKSCMRPSAYREVPAPVSAPVSRAASAQPIPDDDFQPLSALQQQQLRARSYGGLGAHDLTTLAANYMATQCKGNSRKRDVLGERTNAQ